VSVATNRIEFLSPAPPPEVDLGSSTFTLDKPLTGVVVGLRLDKAWRSYITVAEVWEGKLKAAGAIPKVLWTGDHSGPNAAQTRAEVEEWARLVECGVIGLGN
jgi:hypothetical protein